MVVENCWLRHPMDSTTALPAVAHGQRGDEIMIYFDSDYMEGAHPEVMRRLVETNLEHTVGYGCDPYTQQAKEAIRAACAAPNALVQFLEGGTQTNATVIDALLRRHEGVLAAETAHINVHESGAIEHSGHKVLTLPTKDGKLTAEQVDSYITDFYRDETYEHMVAPGMLYITMPTEYGTLYSLSELEQLSEVCHKHHIPLYMDGARLGYALASEACDVTLPDIARLCDVFYIGGTKNGALLGEAVVITNEEIKKCFRYSIKQNGGMYSKGFIAGMQFEALFEDNLYFELAKHANDCACLLRMGLEDLNVEFAFKSLTNQLFPIFPNEIIEQLEKIKNYDDVDVMILKELDRRFRIELAKYCGGDYRKIENMSIIFCEIFLHIIPMENVFLFSF